MKTSFMAINIREIKKQLQKKCTEHEGTKVIVKWDENR